MTTTDHQRGVPDSVPADGEGIPGLSDLFVNRELSWLEFNQRVLDEGRDPDVPLLERLRFLAIAASNLDEFFMVRIGSLKTALRRNPDSRDPAGMTPATA